MCAEAIGNKIEDLKKGRTEVLGERAYADSGLERQDAQHDRPAVPGQ